MEKKIRVLWTLDGVVGCGCFRDNSLWSNVRERVCDFYYDDGKKPDIRRIHVRIFLSLVDRIFADVFGMSISPILPGCSFGWRALRLITEELLSLKQS